MGIPQQISIDVMQNEEIKGLDKILCSGFFKGIGGKTALSIVERFGSDIFNVIKHEPGLLTEIKGITPKKAEEINKSYWKIEDMLDLIIFLKPFDITDRKIRDINEKYGVDAVKQLKDNPYRLCEEVYGFGFKNADLIARACGIGKNSGKRIESAVLYALREAAGMDGHLFLSQRQILIRAKKLLCDKKEEFDNKLIKNELIQMAQRGTVIIENDNYFFPKYYEAECYSANKIKKLVESNTIINNHQLSIRNIIKDLELKNNIQYTEKQKSPAEKMLESDLLIITGGPGTGKTTIIKMIIEVFEQCNPFSEIILTAPTGRAAKRMEETTGHKAMTIHRLIGMKRRKGVSVCMKNEDHPIDADLIIIDESSMIDIILFNNFLKAINKGTKVIFVGDANQLSPVGAGNPFKDMIASKKVPTVILDEIFRQKDTSLIVVNADKINKGAKKLEFGNDFLFVCENDTKKQSGLIKKEIENELKDGKSITDIQILSPARERTEVGTDALNKTLQEIYNPYENGLIISSNNKQFWENDKVVQLVNDHNKQIYNGDIGVVKRIIEEDDALYAEIDFGNELIKYSEADFSSLDLGYATTIHKSQGSEYDTVIMPLTTQHAIFLQRNMFYTAITRAKTKVILVGEWRAFYIALNSNRANERNTSLAARI